MKLSNNVTVYEVPESLCTEDNYRMPEQCCMKCKWVDQTDYGDIICKLHPVGVTVALGGICDLYEAG